MEKWESKDKGVCWVKEGLKGKTGHLPFERVAAGNLNPPSVVFVYSELIGTLLFPSFLLAPSGLQRSDHV